MTDKDPDREFPRVARPEDAVRLGLSSEATVEKMTAIITTIKESLKIPREAIMVDGINPQNKNGRLDFKHLGGFVGVYLKLTGELQVRFNDNHHDFMMTGYDESNPIFPFLKGEGAQSFLERDPQEVALQVAKYVSHVTGLHLYQSGQNHQAPIDPQGAPRPPLS